MRHMIIFVLFMTTGCSSYALRPDERREVLRAIDQERCLGITHGPKVTLEEHSRKIIACNGEKRELISQYLDVSGVCPGECYDLYLISQDDGFISLGEYRVNENLELVEESNQILLKNFVMTLGDYMFGEIVSFAFVNKETKVVSVLVYSPNPIEAKWEDGGYATATSLGPDMCNFCLRCTGFDPQETIHYTSRCCGDVKEVDYPVETDGSLTIILVPNDSDLEGGFNRITLNRPSGERTLKIPFGTYAKDKKYWKNY